MRPLLDNSLMDYALEHLDSNGFVMGKHRAIFATMTELYKRHQDVSPDNIIKELAVHDVLDSVGGDSYIHSLSEQVPQTLTTENVAYIERFALIAVTMSIQAAALSEMQLTDIGNFISEKLGRVKEIRKELSQKRLKSTMEEWLN